MVEFLLDNIFWLVLALVSGVGFAWTFMRDNQISLSPQQAVLKVKRGGGIYLDLRSNNDFAAGHIPAALRVGVDEIARKKDFLSKFKNKPIVLICQNGTRAKQTLRQFKDQQFKEVYVLAGGIDAWLQNSLPLARSQKS